MNQRRSEASRDRERGMSALGAKINRALSGESNKKRPGDRESLASTLVDQPNVPTNGRKPLASFGRGGLGNIRPQPSPPLPQSPPDESELRGRDRTINPNIQHQKLFSTGRGGAGNFRSSRRAVKENRAHPAGEDWEISLVLVELVSLARPPKTTPLRTDR